MRICIDLDGVICKLRGTNGDYSSLEPVPGAVECIKRLKEEGHYIIIYTARRMRTHSGNVGKIMADIGKVTLDWLAKYNIPYDEIVFGKPWADVYIDDNAVRFESWDKLMQEGLPESREVETRGGWN